MASTMASSTSIQHGLVFWFVVSRSELEDHRIITFFVVACYYVYTYFLASVTRRVIDVDLLGLPNRGSLYFFR